MPVEVKLVVSGIVQGVGYRAHCQKIARECGVTGYADNLPGGKVEVLVCGEKEEVERFLKMLKQTKPEGSHIDSIRLLHRRKCEYRPPSFSVI